MRAWLQRFFIYGTWGFELLRSIFIVLILVALSHYFVATVFLVDGISMEPTLHTGQGIVIERVSYYRAAPKRGDVVVLRYPGDPERKKYIKRVIGLPGETISIVNGIVTVNNAKLFESYLDLTLGVTEPDMEKTLGPNEFFTMGDSRIASNDSRVWGVLPGSDIVGRAWIVLTPVSKLHVLVPPTY